MSDYFKDLLGSELIERELTYNGQTKPVWFKPLTAGESLELMKGQALPIQYGPDGRPTGNAVTVSFDLYDNHEKRLKALNFRLCDEKGKRIFRNLAELQQQPKSLIDELLSLLSTVTEEEKDLGKS